MQTDFNENNLFQGKKNILFLHGTKTKKMFGNNYELHYLEYIQFGSGFIFSINSNY